MTSLPIVKFVYAAAILVVSVGGLRLARQAKEISPTATSVANAFAAGIFLATGLLHFGAEAHQQFQMLGARYPWAELSALAAFMVILFVEHVAFSDAAHAAAHAHSGSAHDDHCHYPPAAGSSIRAGIGVLFALSLHSVLAGLALGIAGDVTRVSLAAVAILAHKLTEGFALGTTLTDLPPAKMRLAGWGFAIATPVGVLLGTLLREPLLVGPGILPPLALALAAGTFLYIGAFDLLQDEFLRPGARTAKWFFACLGVAVSALLAAWH